MSMDFNREGEITDCPWCGNRAQIVSSPFGYFVECRKNGHVHNIGVLVSPEMSYQKTKESAAELWETFVKKLKDLKQGDIVKGGGVNEVEE